MVHRKIKANNLQLRERQQQQQEKNEPPDNIIGLYFFESLSETVNNDRIGSTNRPQTFQDFQHMMLLHF